MTNRSQSAANLNPCTHRCWINELLLIEIGTKLHWQFLTSLVLKSHIVIIMQILLTSIANSGKFRIRSCWRQSWYWSVVKTDSHRYRRWQITNINCNRQKTELLSFIWLLVDPPDFAREIDLKKSLIWNMF